MEHGRVSVRTFGRSGQETGALLFVETARGSRSDEAFLLVSDFSRAGRRFFEKAIAEYKRGSPIRTPGQYLEFLDRSASRVGPSEETSGSSAPSFLAAWLRGETHTWASSGDYSFLSVSPAGALAERKESSGTRKFEPGERLVFSNEVTLARLRQRLSSSGGSVPTSAQVQETAQEAAGSSKLESPAAATAVCDKAPAQLSTASEGAIETLLSSLAKESDSGPLVLVVSECPADTERECASSSAPSPGPPSTPAVTARRAGSVNSPSAFRGLRKASKAARSALGDHRSRRWVLPVGGAVLLAVILALVWPGLRGLGPPRVEDVADAPEPVATSATQSPTRAPNEAAGTDTPPSVAFSSKWKRKFRGAVTSSPTVVEGKVYFGCRDGHLYCLDAETGEQVWKFSAGAGIGSSPLVSNGNVLVGSYDGRFWSVDAATGRKNWEFKTGGKVVSSPCVSSGSVLFGSYDKNLYCLSERDGKLRWKHATAGVVWSSPSVSRGRVFFGSADGSFYCLSLDSGQQHWREVVPGGIYSSPAIQDKVVCFGSIGKVVYFLDVADGRKLFKVDAGGEVRASPLLVDETAYVAADDGIVRCISVGKADVNWTFKTNREVRSRPCLSDGLLFVTSYDGRLYALSPSSGEQIGSFDAGAQIYSSPFVWEQKVYFGTNSGDFHCVQQESPSP